jgi:DNA-binding transcriptional ArsR family regulator
MSFEEDTYSRIFAALKHPVRRRILSILNEEPLTYTELLNRLNVETGFLNYHLENLSELISKNEEGRYRLSEFGEAAQSLTARVEAPIKKRFGSVNVFGHRIENRFISFGLISLLILSNFFFVFTIHSQSIDGANIIGASLLQTRGLMVDSIATLNITVSRDDFDGADLYSLYGNLVKISSQCDFLCRLDVEHTGYWAQMRDAVGSLSGLVLQLSQQTSFTLTNNGSNSTKLSWLNVESIAHIRDDLIIILKAFPADTTTGLNPHFHLDGVMLSAAADASNKMIVDIKYARYSFYLGEPFTVMLVSGSPSSGEVFIIKEVNGTYSLLPK